MIEVLDKQILSKNEAKKIMWRNLLKMSEESENPVFFLVMEDDKWLK